MDAVQDLTNQAQGPAVQNQAQGQAVQGPANNNAQVSQNVPVQPPQHPAPAQPVPAGPVVPPPQVFYQNWIGKKPEFSGKPEEVSHFCLTLTGEARLWYESRIYQSRARNQNRNQQNFTPRNRTFGRGTNQIGNRGKYNYRNNYRPNYRNRSRGRWNNKRSGDRSNNYPINNRQGNTRPNYGQNTQWTFRNRSESRNKAGNNNNDFTRA